MTSLVDRSKVESDSSITQISTGDVILGRGAGPNEHKGNIAFRATVAGFKPAYMATTKRKIKNKIARKVIRAIQAKNGRFLQRAVKSSEEVYEIAADAVVLEKTKQALRHLERAKRSSSKACDAIKKRSTPSTSLSPPCMNKFTSIDVSKGSSTSTNDAPIRKTLNALSVNKLLLRPKPMSFEALVQAVACPAALAATTNYMVPSNRESTVNALAAMLAFGQPPAPQPTSIVEQQKFLAFLREHTKNLLLPNKEDIVPQLNTPPLASHKPPTSPLVAALLLSKRY